MSDEHPTLTSSTSNGKVIQKTTVIKSDSFSFATSNLCSNVCNLNFVTHFTATACDLLSGHLEQISLAALQKIPNGLWEILKFGVSL